MSYYHVRISEYDESGNRYDENEYALDLTKNQLEKRFLSPYKKGRSIVISGKTISSSNLERISIYFTGESSDEILGRIDKERHPLLPDGYYVTEKGVDVTDEFITEPPGSGVDEENREDEPEVDKRKVFVVHGRNLQIKNSMFDFLRAIDLHPIEWVEAIEATDDPSPYIGDILDEAFSTAQAVVFLMTPDDEARLREEFREEQDPLYEKELTPQPRPNVLFEGGMAMAKHPGRTVIVKIGNLRPFSDIQGMHYVKLDNTTETRRELATKLENAGCLVEISGTDWCNAGNFEIKQN